MSLPSLNPGAVESDAVASLVAYDDTSEQPQNGTATLLGPVQGAEGEWRKCRDASSGQDYFWNVKTGETTWEEPTTTTTAIGEPASTQQNEPAPQTEAEIIDNFLDDIDRLTTGADEATLLASTTTHNGEVSGIPHALSSSVWTALADSEREELQAEALELLEEIDSSGSNKLDVLRAVLVARLDDLQRGGLVVSHFRVRLEEAGREVRAVVDSGARPAAPKIVEGKGTGQYVAATTTDGQIVYVDIKRGRARSEAPRGWTGELPAPVVKQTESEPAGGGEDTNQTDGGVADAGAREEGDDGELAVMSSLPPGTGRIVSNSLVIFVQPEADLTVPNIQAQFLDRELVAIRAMGAGFAVVEFEDEEEAELARALDIPPADTRAWAVTAPNFFTRVACDSDGVDLYPIVFPEDKAAAAAAVQPHVAAVAEDMEVDMEVEGDAAAESRPTAKASATITAAAAVQRVRAKDTEMRAAAQLQAAMAIVSAPAAPTQPAEKAKVVKVGSKLRSSKVSAQMQKWSAQQNKVKQDEEATHEKMSVESLEATRKRKAEEWAKEQMDSGSHNPNFIPLGGGKGGKQKKPTRPIILDEEPPVPPPRDGPSWR